MNGAIDPSVALMTTFQTPAPGLRASGPAGGPEMAQLSSATATPRQRTQGIAAQLGSSSLSQTGAALGTMAFPVMGAVGVVAVRQLVTALVLVPTVRPRLRGLGAGVWWPVLGLSLVFSVMNLCLYLSIDRIGLGLAVTLEFLGPLAVAVAGSRRLLDGACALVAGAGVVVLTAPGPSTDVLGIALGLLAAAAWASYILLNRLLGQRLPGLQGTATASLVTAAAWTPVAIIWFTLHPPSAGALALALACGVLASVVPYAADVWTLRRVPAPVFGTIASCNPVWAVLVGWLMLRQSLEAHEWLGMVLIVVANMAVSLSGLRRGRRAAKPRPEAGRTSAGERRRGLRHREPVEPGR